MIVEYIFPTVQKCILAIAASYMGVAEDPSPDAANPQITYWQRTGGIYSSPDDSLLWSGLFLNAIATECNAERVHDSWTGEGATYGNKPYDWTRDDLLPNSDHVSFAYMQPGDIVVWQAFAGENGYRSGVFLSWARPDTAFVIAGDVNNAVSLTTVSNNGFVDARRLFYFFGY